MRVFTAPRRGVGRDQRGVIIPVATPSKCHRWLPFLGRHPPGVARKHPKKFSWVTPLEIPYGVLFLTGKSRPRLGCHFFFQCTLKKIVKPHFFILTPQAPQMGVFSMKIGSHRCQRLPWLVPRHPSGELSLRYTPQNDRDSVWRIPSSRHPKNGTLKFRGVGEYIPGTLNCAALVPFRGVWLPCRCRSTPLRGLGGWTLTLLRHSRR